MSSGLGHVQREALAYLRGLPRTRGGARLIVPVWLIAEVVYGHLPPTTKPGRPYWVTPRGKMHATVAQRTAVRRAMKRLLDAELVEDWYNSEAPQRIFYCAKALR